MYNSNIPLQSSKMLFFLLTSRNPSIIFPKKVPVLTNQTFQIFQQSSPFRHQPNPTKKQPSRHTLDSSTTLVGWERIVPNHRRFDDGWRLQTSGYALPPPPELDGFKSIFTGLTEKASDFRLAVSLVVWRFFRFGPLEVSPWFSQTGVGGTNTRWVWLLLWCFFLSFFHGWIE